MGNLVSIINKEKYHKLIFFIFIFSLLLIPPIHLPWFRFKFQLVDFFMPFFIGLIVVNKWYKNWLLFNVKNLIFLAAIALISILINNYCAINDYFEIYRLFTFICIFIVFKEIYNPQFTNLTIDVIFICLLIFNFLHYHNLFNFNGIVMPLYCGQESPHLFFFGLNSALAPATKRMLGTLGNPNNNAILFLFFNIWYFPKKKWSIKEIIFFFLSVIAVCSCQSRTGIVAFTAVFLLNFIFAKIKWWKMILQSTAVMLVCFLFFNTNNLLDFSFLGQYKQTRKKENKDYVLADWNAFNGTSWKTRLKIWEELFEQTLEKPIIGHAPQKNYFYHNKLYAENEYIFMAWRYGFLGLIFYLLIFIIPLKDTFCFARSQLEARRILLFIVVFLIAAITNVPLSNTILSLLFFSYLGIFYSQRKDENHEILA